MRLGAALRRSFSLEEESQEEELGAEESSSSDSSDGVATSPRAAVSDACRAWGRVVPLTALALGLSGAAALALWPGGGSDGGGAHAATSGLEAVGLSFGQLLGGDGAVAPSANSPCSLSTAGTCRFTGQCDKSRGNTTCRSGLCMCAPGHCANSAGVCLRAGQAVARPAAAPAVRAALGLHVISRDLMCEDTPEWTDGWIQCAYDEGGNRTELCPPSPGADWPLTRGWTCRAYSEKGWCGGGSGASSRMGILHNRPESNCCACGGGRKIASQPLSGGARAAAAAAEEPGANCSRVTGGACAWTRSCGRFRGPAACVDGRCLCLEGYCSDVAGTCHPQAPSTPDTATRVVREALGLHREPEGGLCQDSPGWTDGWTLCAYEEGGRRSELCRPSPGVAWPLTAGWTCQAYAEKGWCKGGHVARGHLGAFFPEQHCCACGGGTTILKEGGLRAGRAAPAPQLLANASEAQCSRDTGGTCRLLGRCRSFRNAAMCEAQRCVCEAGYCADTAGACYRNLGFVRADVVPVHQGHPVFPGRHGQARAGLCISGGGSRSAASALGLLRALHHLGLLPGVDALSAVSGGAWASAAFVFANGSLAELLGEQTDPSRLTLSALAARPAALGAVATAATARAAVDLKAGGVPMEALWVSTIAKAVLGPFSLGDQRLHMAADRAAAARIAAANPQLAERDFLVPQPGRPGVFIIGGTVEAPSGYRASSQNVVSLQMSPDYAGSPFYPDNRTVSYESSLGPDLPPLESVLLGGGLVETFAFGGEGPTGQESGGTGVRLRAPVKPFSLAQALGVSSAAFAGAATQAGLLGSSAGSRLTPQGSIWPVTSDRHPGPRQTIAFELGDGGNIDNTGIMALLQRRVPKIAMVVNTGKPLNRDIDFCAAPPDFDTSGTVSSQLSALFGFPAKDDLKGLFWTKNQVFAKAELLPLLCRLGTLRRAGKPLVSRQRLEVQANSWWGIRGGSSVDLLVVLLDKSEEFEALLPVETRAEVDKGSFGRFAHFPHYRTVFQTSDLTALNSDQVNLLAAQTEYAVTANAGEFREIFR